MPFAVPRTVLLLASMAILSAPVPLQTAESAQFPPVTADSLSKQTLHLPADFGGDDTLVLVAFERDQQKEIDTWTAPLNGLAKLRPAFHYYELPVLPWRDVFYRWWLNTAMRSGVPDDASRKRTVPLYLNKANFKSALQIDTEKTISVLLLDKSAHVQWRTTGTWTDDKQKALAAALERTR